MSALTAKVCASAILVFVPLVAATWIIPPEFPLLSRQLLLSAWGVGAIVVAERRLFSRTLSEALRAIGFVRPRTASLAVSVLVSLPMWAFLPLMLWTQGLAIALRTDWLQLLAGVVLVNGMTEEVIHRGFVFGHLRRDRSFAAAAALSAAVFALQHVYIVVTMGWTIGIAAVLLAALLAFPLAFVYERGGNAIGGPAILHTSSNAPAIVFALPQEFLATALLPHMAVVLVSLYGVFALRRFLTEPA